MIRFVDKGPEASANPVTIETMIDEDRDMRVSAVGIDGKKAHLMWITRGGTVVLCNFNSSLLESLGFKVDDDGCVKRVGCWPR